MTIANTLSTLLTMAMTASSKRGPYRYLVKNWQKYSDVDLVAKMMCTEFFRNELMPQELPVGDVKSYLVLAPHQDDETIGAGGSLLLANQAGASIDVLFLTDGAQVSANLRETPAEIVDIRNREAKEVCDAMGARMHHLDICNLSPSPTLDDLDRLASLIHERRPQVLMAPWLLDSPAKHRLAYHLLWLADQRRRLPDCEVWGYQVHNSLYPNGYVDITAVADEKRRLLECYRSQNEQFHRYDHHAMGMAAWNGRILPGRGAGFAELFFTLPLREALSLVERYYFEDLRAVYGGKRQLVECMSELHFQVTGRRLSGTRARPLAVGAER